MKHFNTLVLSLATCAFGFAQQVLIEDFENNPSVEGFEGLTTVIEAAPTGSNGSSLKLIASDTGQLWQGGKVTLSEPKMDLTTDKTIKIDVYSESAFTVMAKVEGAGSPASADLEEHSGTGWETITFTFDTGADGTTTADGVYDLIAIFPFRKSDDSGWNTPSNFTFYIDNVMAEEASSSTPTAAPETAAPTPPARAAEDVVSIYSDAYDNIAIDNFDAGWCGGAATTEVLIESNNTLKKNSGVDCHGIDFSNNRQDLSEFTHLHFDFYITDEDLTGDVFNVKLVDFAGGSAEASALEVNINGGTKPALVADTWVSVDVDITELVAPLAGSLNRSDVAQIGITTANVSNVWYDNIYLYKGNALNVKEEVSVQNVKMYPNPVKAGQNVMFTSNVKDIQVYSAEGKLVKVSKTETLSTNGLSQGLYFVVIKDENERSQTQKLIVK